MIRRVSLSYRACVIGLFALILPGAGLVAQTITPQVINSAGLPDRQAGNQNFYYSDNLGEPFVMTHTALTAMISEGFLQAHTGKTYTYTIQRSPVTCREKKDGLIAVIFNSIYANVT